MGVFSFGSFFSFSYSVYFEQPGRNRFVGGPRALGGYHTHAVQRGLIVGTLLFTISDFLRFTFSFPFSLWRCLFVGSGRFEHDAFAFDHDGWVFGEAQLILPLQTACRLLGSSAGKRCFLSRSAPRSPFSRRSSASLSTIRWQLSCAAIKVPQLPFHLWLIEAHVEAPTAASVLLAAIR